MLWASPAHYCGVASVASKLPSPIAATPVRFLFPQEPGTASRGNVRPYVQAGHINTLCQNPVLKSLRHTLRIERAASMRHTPAASAF